MCVVWKYAFLSLPAAKQVSISRIRLRNPRGELESVIWSQTLFFKSSFFSFMFKL